MSHQATAPDLLHYRHLDPLYRAAVGDRLHHGLWKDPRLSLAAAQSALETEVADIITGLQPQRVLDVGCGYGHLLRSLAPTGIPHLAGVNANPEPDGFSGR